MGGTFINYFNRFGRQWQVYVQAEGEYRTDVNNLGEFYVRNAQNEMVPLSTVTRIERRAGPEFTMRYNLYRCAQINAAVAPGYTSDQAMKALEEVFANSMPPEMGYDYLGMSFQEKQTQQGVPPAAIFGFSLLFVFLDLSGVVRKLVAPIQRAAQYTDCCFRSIWPALFAAVNQRAVSAFLSRPDRKQRLCPNRLGYDHWTRCQERHFDR